MLYSWYLIDELPQLTTSIFIRRNFFFQAIASTMAVVATMSFSAGTSGEIADRLGEALQERPDRSSAGHVLGELVGDVASVQVGKHQHVRLPRDITGGLHFLGGHFRDDCGIQLELAIEKRGRGPRGPGPAPA